MSEKISSGIQELKEQYIATKGMDYTVIQKG